MRLMAMVFEDEGKIIGFRAVKPDSEELRLDPFETVRNSEDISYGSFSRTEGYVTISRLPWIGEQPKEEK